MPIAWADEMRVRQVLLNLLNNAVKFTPGGSITLRVRPVDRGNHDFGMIRIEVEDSGPGIPVGMREKLFSEFVQLGDPATHKFRGAGLGLSISRRLIALMGGAIGLEAGANGRGTLAWFTLPQAHTPAMVSSAPRSGNTQ